MLSSTGQYHLFRGLYYNVSKVYHCFSETEKELYRRGRAEHISTSRRYSLPSRSSAMFKHSRFIYPAQKITKLCKAKHPFCNRKRVYSGYKLLIRCALFSFIIFWNNFLCILFYLLRFCQFEGLSISGRNPRSSWSTWGCQNMNVIVLLRRHLF